MRANGIVLPEIDPAVAQREIEDFLTCKMLEAGAGGGVIGLSGGLDSTTVAYLAASAFRQHNSASPSSRKLNLIGLILPSATNKLRDKKDALQTAKELGIEHHVIEIQPIADLFREKLPDILNTKKHLGNLASEIRAVILSRYAAVRNCLVLGTGNRDEDYCLGYFTKRGDGAVDINPLGALSKRHVRLLASHLGVPSRIVNKTPAAGLWHGQTDEGELGFSYEFAELVIAGREQGLAPTRIAELLGCNTAAVQHVIDIHVANRHKMHMPAIAPVSYRK